MFGIGILDLLMMGVIQTYAMSPNQQTHDIWWSRPGNSANTEHSDHWFI